MVSKTAAIPAPRSKGREPLRSTRAVNNPTRAGPRARRQSRGRRAALNASFSSRRGNGARSGARPSHRAVLPCKSVFRLSGFESACGGSTPPGAIAAVHAESRFPCRTTETGTTETGTTETGTTETGTTDTGTTDTGTTDTGTTENGPTETDDGGVGLFIEPRLSLAARLSLLEGVRRALEDPAIKEVDPDLGPCATRPDSSKCALYLQILPPNAGTEEGSSPR
jgi:hypothetical protein